MFTYASDDPHSSPGHERLVTVTFSDLGTKTKMTFHQAVFESVAARNAHEGGWAGTLERLAAYLAAEVHFEPR